MAIYILTVIWLSQKIRPSNTRSRRTNCQHHSAHRLHAHSTTIGLMLGVVLGTTTAARMAVTTNHDGNDGGFENTTLAIGLDGGTLLGAISAPHLDWSPKRAKLVFASTLSERWPAP